MARVKQIRISPSEEEGWIIEMLAKGWKKKEAAVVLIALERSLPEMMRAYEDKVRFRLLCENPPSENDRAIALDDRPKLNCKTIAHLVNRFIGRLVEYKKISSDRLRALASGEDLPTELEIARIALCLGVSEEEVEEIVQRSKSEVSNGNS